MIIATTITTNTFNKDTKDYESSIRKADKMFLKITENSQKILVVLKMGNCLHSFCLYDVEPLQDEQVTDQVLTRTILQANELIIGD